ncbi:antitoxin VbhA family protein [Curtobacterium citreum]
MTTTRHRTADDTVAKRSADVEAVIHSGRLEGFEDDPEWIEQMQRYARGEIDIEDLQDFADRT